MILSLATNNARFLVWYYHFVIFHMHCPCTQMYDLRCFLCKYRYIAEVISKFHLGQKPASTTWIHLGQ